MSGLLDPRGDFKSLLTYQKAELLYDLTFYFAHTHLSRGDRTVDQMVQAARSGKQNIAEGSMASGTSKKTELKLVGVARASLEELLLDFQDYLRQHSLELWGKEHTQARQVRALCYSKNRSYLTYKSYLEPPASAELAANTLICVIHQTNYLLDQQLRTLEKEFLEEGGFTEKLYRARTQRREWKRQP